MVKKKLIPAAGGDWVVGCVYRTPDGSVVEGTRFELHYSHSFVAGPKNTTGDVAEQNIGYLVRGRMREALRKAGVKW